VARFEGREQRSSPRRRWSYSLAVAAVAFAYVLKVSYAAYLVPPFILFYPTVFLVAVLGGVGPGIVATVGSALLAAYLLHDSHGAALFQDFHDGISLTIFTATGVALALTVGRLHRVRVAAAMRARELQALLDAVPAAVFITRDPEARTMETNPFGATLMKVTPPANVSKSAAPGERPTSFRAMKDGVEIPHEELPVQVAAKGKAVKDYEFDLVTVDGTARHLIGNAAPLLTEAGALAGAVGAFMDITAHRDAHEEIQKKEAKLRAYFDSPAVGIAITGPEMQWLEVNDQACMMFGYSRDELTQRTWAELSHPDDVGADLAEFTRVMAGEIDRYALDKRYVRKDGSILWALLSVSCVRRADRSIEYFVAILKDIGVRKQIEADLRVSEDKYRKLIDNLNAGVVVHAPDTAIILSNSKADFLLGLSPDQLRGKVALDPGWRFVHEDGTTMPPDEYPVARVVRSGEPLVNQVLGIDRPRDGSRVWVLVSAYPAFHGDGALQHVVVTFIDISRRKEAETHLRHAEEALRAETALLGETLKASPTGFAVLRGRAFRYEMVNPAYQSIDPRRELLGRTYAECWPEIAQQVLPIFDSVISTGDPFHADDARYFIERENLGRVEEAYFSYSFHRLPEDAQGEPGLLVTVTETTGQRKAESERSALQDQLAVASRLASLGTLVAGVAHEINNPLAAEVSGQGFALELARDARERRRQGTQPDVAAEILELDQMIEALEDAQRGGHRVARIVKDLAAFGRSDPTRTRVRLVDVVEDAMRWLPASVGAAATVRVENHDPPEVLASPGQIEQVVLNLVSNAAKATPAGARGEVVIRIGTGETGRAYLEVVDHGVGISPSILNQIFDPFFTTRPVGEGRGTGLGLAISHTIMTAHGGTLTVESVVGRGSTFRAELPGIVAQG
jgi:PAS domain S-box-containing protein